MRIGQAGYRHLEGQQLEIFDAVLETILRRYTREAGVRELERVGDDVKFFVDCDAAFADLLVDKGSVAIDGVSLTVVDVEPRGFHVVLIPHTLERTTLGRRAAGSPLNLEADVLGKYVKRYLDRVT